MIRRTTLAALSALALAGAPALAADQNAGKKAPPPAQPAPSDRSPHELRQENERLRDRVSELEAELAEARRRIAKLEDAVRELSGRQPGPAPAALPGAPAQAPAQAPPVDELPPLPDDPFASPDAMLQALRKQYQEALGALPRETEPQVQQLIREARRWVRQASLEKRRPIEWTVRVLAVSPPRQPGSTEPRASGEAVVEVVNDKTGESIGSPFTLALESREVARLREAGLPSIWKFGGVFAAAPSVDESRAEPGLFNVPKLVGPFVAFGYELSVRSMRLASPAEPQAKPE